MLFQVDAQKKRFLFMYYGRKFDVKFFQEKFELASVEGSTDDRGCHFVFLKTATQIRTSQLHAAINEYNLIVPSGMAMRLQEEIYQPVIVTMSSRRMEGSIYSKIIKDKQTRCEGGTSNYWFWDPELEERLSSADEVGRLQLLVHANGSVVSSEGSSKQCELVAVVRDQYTLLGDSSCAVAEAMVQINELDAEKTRLVSVLGLVNANVTAMASEIDQFKSAATANASKLVRAVAAKDLLEIDLEDKQLDLEAKGREVDDLKYSISSKEALIATLQQDGMEDRGAQVTALKKELEVVRKDYDVLYEGYETELKEKHEAWDSIRDMQNPGTSQSSAPQRTSAFSCILSAVQFAETACVESEDGKDWDHSELKRRVFDMVQVMMPNAKRNVIDRNVHEVNNPLFNLCSKVIDHRRVRKSQGALLQGGCAVPSLEGSAKKRRKTDGKGGSGDYQYGYP